MIPARQQSNLARYLYRKTLEGSGKTAAVKTVTKNGSWRTVEYYDGTKETFSKRRIQNMFNKTLQTNQARLSLKSIREMRDGRATALIGGKVKGERREYANPQAARRAVKRAYPKASLWYVK